MSVNLYYTGGAKPFDLQPEPLLSLGLYISESQVPEDFQGGLFPEITEAKILENKSEYVLLALKNEGTITQDQIDFTIITKSTRLCDFSVGIEVPRLDCETDLYQTLPNRYSQPRGIQFANCTSVMGESLIKIMDSVQSEEVVDLFVDGNLAGSLSWGIKPEVLFEEEDFQIDVRFNYTTGLYEIFLVQEDILNFSNVITAEVEGTGLQIELENKLPQSNIVSFANAIVAGRSLGLHLRRRSNQKVLISLKKDVNCDTLFKEYRNKVEKEKQDIFILSINHQDEVA